MCSTQLLRSSRRLVSKLLTVVVAFVSRIVVYFIFLSVFSHIPPETQDSGAIQIITLGGGGITNKTSVKRPKGPKKILVF